MSKTPLAPPPGDRSVKTAPPPPPPWRHWLWAVALLVTLLWIVTAFLPTSSTQSLSYTQFRNDVAAHKIKTVTIPSAGAADAKGKTIGLNIGLPFEQFPNPYITNELNFEFHYFFMRKYWFAYLAKALVVFPGGFGTLDEMFELLTLAQTQKLAKKITVVVYGSAYWQSVLNLDVLVDKGAISPRDRDLFKFADTPEEAFEMLRHGLTENYLAAEVAAAAAGRHGPSNTEGLMAGWTVEDFLGPEIAKTRK